MKKIICILVILTTLSALTSAGASECIVRSVNRLAGFSDSLRPNMEKILRQKGYTVIEDGLLYESYDVPVDQLTVREELLQRNDYIAANSGILQASKPTDMCTKWISGIITCTFSFNLYKINEKGEATKIVQIDSSIKEKPTYFRSETKIAKKFMADILTSANREIPNCK